MLNGFAGLRQLRPFVIYDNRLRAQKLGWDIFIPKKLLYVDILVTGRGDYTGAANDSITISFNGDVTDANYRVGSHCASTASHSFSGSATRGIGLITSTGSGGSLGAANQSGYVRATIIDPSNNLWYKQVDGQSSVLFTTEIETWTRALTWKNVSPITKLSIAAASATLQIGSRCVVIGYAIG